MPPHHHRWAAHGSVLSQIPIMPTALVASNIVNNIVPTTLSRPDQIWLLTKLIFCFTIMVMWIQRIPIPPALVVRSMLRMVMAPTRYFTSYGLDWLLAWSSRVPTLPTWLRKHHRNLFLRKNFINFSINQSLRSTAYLNGHIVTAMLRSIKKLCSANDFTAKTPYCEGLFNRYLVTAYRY